MMTQPLSAFFLSCFAFTATISQARFTPVKIATSWYNTCAISTEGALKCWGSNREYQLGTGNTYNYGGNPNSMGTQLPYVSIGSGLKVADVCSMNSATCAATTDGRVKCWGEGEKGQLGQGADTTMAHQMGDALKFTNLGPQFYATNLSCGAHHVCALSNQGQVKCWGSNDKGQLGIGSTVNRGLDAMGDSLPTVLLPGPAREITTSTAHTCARFDDGILCWGGGEYGQLGQESFENLGNTPSKSDFRKVPYIKLEAPGVPVKLRRLASGAGMNCVIYEKADQDHVKCWGVGHLGGGGFVTHGNRKESMGEHLPEALTGFTKISDIAPHHRYTCVLSKSGQVKCWGDGLGGRLGLGDYKARSYVNEMGGNLPPVKLGLPARVLSSGSQSGHSCAILINHEMKCWGTSDYGQLGYEDLTERGGHPSDMDESLPFIDLN